MEEPKIFERMLTCVLSDEEVRERAAKASRLLGDLEEARVREKNAERAKKRAAEELPETARLAEAEHIEGEARKAARVSREGKEERLVQCRWEPQGEREVLVRLDTGELIDSRVAERQTSLPLDGDTPAEGLN